MRALIVALVLMLATPAPARAEDVTVFAAASLKTALDAAAAAWRAAGGAGTRLAYAGSSTLARQIEQGAPADLFVSADRDWMDYLASRRLIRPGTRVDLLGNALVLIAPAASPATLAIAPGFDLAGALGRDRLAMANVAAVPAGRYGKAALEALGVWREVTPKAAQTDDVRAALFLVARGETPFGIVYRTDALAEPRVRIVDVFPAETHPPIVYPAAIVAASRQPRAAELLAFLRAAPAKAIFESHGFVVRN